MRTLTVPALSLALLVPAADLSGQSQTRLAVQTIGSFSRPVDIQAPPGDESRIFVVTQRGTIRVVKNGTTLLTPFLNVSGLVSQTGNERGLLGLAFDPDFEKNGFFYIDYTRSSDGATMVVRYNVSSSDPDVADPGSAKTVIGPISQPYSNHNGGGLAFGPDRFLYIGLGDGGSGGDPGCRAQSGGTLLGKLLRIEPLAAGGYRVPPSNPFVGNPNVRDEIWALGLRNPWRYCFDRKTGDLYIGDVGQNTREEVDFQPAASKGGENYGWNIMEGTFCYRSTCSTIPCRDARLTLPIYDYPRGRGGSVTGGCVYRGAAIPDLCGTYFFADYVQRQIWSFRYDGKTIAEFKSRNSELGSGLIITSFGQDGRGELYMADFGGGGRVLKIVPAQTPPIQDLGFGKVGGNGQTPRFTACGQLISGRSAEFELTRAPGTAIAILMISTQRNDSNIFGGTFLPVPPQLAVHFVTTANGKVAFTVPGGGGPLRLYGQYVILDTGASFGIGFSNALKIDFQP